MDNCDILKKIEEVVFFDLEVNPSTNEIVDVGACFGGEKLHTRRIEPLLEMIKKARFSCGKPCLLYSKAFAKKLEMYLAKGYKIYKAEAECVFWWQKQANQATNTTYEEIKIILPKLYLRGA